MLTPVKAKTKKDSEKGMALIEAIPALFMLIIVFNFSLGFFGAIHSGILNSIASYNYTIETFRFRSNLMYFRPGSSLDNYKAAMVRVHGVVSDGVQARETRRSRWPATARPIALKSSVTGLGTEVLGDADHSYRGKDDSNNVWWYADEDNIVESLDEAPKNTEIWVKTIYGICLNAECGISN